MRPLIKCYNLVWFDLQTNEFIRDMEKYPIHSFGLLDPPKALSDVVESLFGAIYVDTKFDDTAEKVCVCIRILIRLSACACVVYQIISVHKRYVCQVMNL
jgi:hypothetical protein